MSTEAAALEEYYTELDPSKRFLTLSEKLSDVDGHSFRLHLFQLRHGEDTSSITQDLFLWQCVNLSSLYGGFFFREHKKNELLQSLKGMGFDLAQTDLEKQILYWELRNAIKRYIKTADSPGFRRKAFGILSSSDEEKQAQVCKDLWKMSFGLSEQFGLREDMLPLCSAANDEYVASYQDAESLEEDYHKHFSNHVF